MLTPPAGPLGSFPRQSLAPGAAVSASLAGGDISLGAVGTVTYRDGERVVAFGHPLDSAGTRSLLMQDAYVYWVIANPGAAPDFASYKLASPGHDVGTVGFDGLTAVTGRFGPAAAHHPPGGDRTRPERAPEPHRGPGRRRALARPAQQPPRGGGPRPEPGQRARAAQQPGPRHHLDVREGARARGAPRRSPSATPTSTLAGPRSISSEPTELLEGYFGRLTVTDVSARLRVRRGVSEALLVRGRAPRVVRPRPARAHPRRRPAPPRRAAAHLVRHARPARPAARPARAGGGPDRRPSLAGGGAARAAGGLVRAAAGWAWPRKTRSQMPEEDPADAAGDPHPRRRSAPASPASASRQGLNARFSGTGRRFVLRTDTRFRGKIEVPGARYALGGGLRPGPGRPRSSAGRRRTTSSLKSCGWVACLQGGRPSTTRPFCTWPSSAWSKVCIP